MKRLNWITDSEKCNYMKRRQSQNRISCVNSKAETWMYNILVSKTKYCWTRQAMWGFRLFDFWNAGIGCAVEVDGVEHNYKYDLYRDEYNFRRSGIVVVRVSNYSEQDALRAIAIINHLNTLTERKIELGIDGNSKAARQSLSSQPFVHSMRDEYIRKFQ